MATMGIGLGLEWHLGLVLKNKMRLRNSWLFQEWRVPVRGCVCVLWDDKTQIRAAEERDDRWQLVLKCCGRELQGWLIMCVRDWALVLWCCKALQRSHGSTHCSAAATGESSTDSKFQGALLLTRDKRLLLLVFWSWMRLLYYNVL